MKLYFVDAANKEYEFWQRDSLPFELLNKEPLTKSLTTFTTLRMPSIGSYAKSQLIIITLLQNFMKREFDYFGFLKHIGEVI